MEQFGGPVGQWIAFRGLETRRLLCTVMRFCTAVEIFRVPEEAQGSRHQTHYEEKDVEQNVGGQYASD